MTDSPVAEAKLSVTRCAFAAAIATLALFVLCWTWAVIGMPASHAAIGLFTPQPIGSAAALWTGGLCAFAFGGIVGGLFAVCYNFAGSVVRRGAP